MVGFGVLCLGIRDKLVLLERVLISVSFGPKEGCIKLPNRVCGGLLVGRELEKDWNSMKTVVAKIQGKVKPVK